MTPPRPSASVTSELADAAEHGTAEAVAWSGGRAVVVGSAGATDATPAGTDPLAVDGARYHGWIRAVDAHGAAIWTRRLDAGREVHVRAVAPVGNDLVVAGEQRSGDAREYTGWVARIGSDGGERWRLDGLGAAGATGLQALAGRADGSVVAGGMRRGVAWLIAIDARGKLVRDEDVAGLDEITAVMPAGDIVVVAGIAGRTTTSAGTSRLIAMDATGATRWRASLPEHGPGELFALAPLGDGGVAVGQAPDARGRDGAWIVRFGAGGAIRSSQVLSAEDAGAARGVAVSGDGGYVVAGSVFEAPRGRRASVWRFDRSNKLLWTQVYGDSESFARGVAALPDGGAVVVGAAQAVGAKLRPWIIGVDQGGAQRGMAP